MRIKELLEESKALLSGHFILSSGLHSPHYLQCALMLQYPAFAEEAGRLLADLFRDLKPSAVVSPALGGVVIGQEAGRALGVRAIFCERTDGPMALRRGFTLEKGDRVVVVEDVVTTGKSVREVMEVVRACGAETAAVGSLVFRAKENPFGVDYRHLWQVEFPVYKPEACPLCAAGSPAVKPGSRKQ